ncbi:conserved hypothetical protein, partial [Trichinella spiralis]|uniref:hypothetical protein n=1 Tax=Trichinella spiralis TaxID=6334 RepID=UPI0001EFD698
MGVRQITAIVMQTGDSEFNGSGIGQRAQSSEQSNMKGACFLHHHHHFPAARNTRKTRANPSPGVAVSRMFTVYLSVRINLSQQCCLRFWLLPRSHKLAVAVVGKSPACLPTMQACRAWAKGHFRLVRSWRGVVWLGVAVFCLKMYGGVEAMEELASDVFAFLLPWTERVKLALIVLAGVMLATTSAMCL